MTGEGQHKKMPSDAGRIRYCELTMKIQKQDDMVIALQMTKLRYLLWPKSKSMLGFI